MDGGEALWHVTLTVGGVPMDPVLVHAALRRLATERPFMLGGRYGPDRAEVRYWEEAPSRGEAASMARSVWQEHRQTAVLPCLGGARGRGGEPNDPPGTGRDRCTQRRCREADGWRPF